MNFSDLKLIPPLLRALAEEGYSHPTPIQERAIPVVLLRRDLLGCAQTGTGKTAAFAAPILQILYHEPRQKSGRPPIRALIVTPTRELAIQIGESFATYGKHLPLKHTVVFGGVSQQNQTRALQTGVDILIATPGRLLDLMNQGFISLHNIQILVLDEADRMLDMGFFPDVKKIIAKLPARRQTLFFSATMPPEIVKLSHTILIDPVKIEVTPNSSTVDTVRQAVYYVDKPNKISLLIHLLQEHKVESALVFTRTKHGADKVARILNRAGVVALAIHGNKTQSVRQRALGKFKSGELRVLVATDIAARGLDIEALSHVINMDIPNIPESYVHRIGRTARAGASGHAISMCSFDEKEYLKDIQQLIKKSIPVIDGHPFPLTATAPSPKADSNVQRSTNRPSRPYRTARSNYRSSHENRKPR